MQPCDIVPILIAAGAFEPGGALSDPSPLLFGIVGGLITFLALEWWDSRRRRKQDDEAR